MLKYPCLILDHDDTVVQSEATINYPFFCYILDKFRPGTTITKETYTRGCCHLGFAQMCREYYDFSEQELADEFAQWKDYVRKNVPPPYPGIAQIIKRQKEAGGLICVVSHSSQENITRDYQAHFGILPDSIYGWDLPEEKRKPSTFPLEDIMERYGLNPNQLLVVDDLKPAWQMASKAGVAIGYAGWSRDDCPEIAEEMEKLCDFSFRSTQELYDFLFR